MKTKFRIIVLLQIVLVSLFAFVSCEEVEEEEARKPDVQIVTSGIAISFAIDEDARYANIYRKKIDDGKNAEVLNIGEIIPSKDSTNDSYSFVDNFLVTDTKYSYCIRYKHEKGFVYSGWSDWPVNSEEEDKTPPTTSFAADENLKYTIPEDTYFEYTETTKCLTLKGTAIAAVTGFSEFSPCICVCYEDMSRIFSIEGYSSKGAGIPIDVKIDLRTLLTQDFFDKDIEIKGVLYQKTDTTKPSYEQVCWSQLSQVPLKNEEGKALTSINIAFNSSSDDNHDFTNLDGTRSLTID